MLKNLGRLIWSQTRDMHVFNYPKAIVYEIRTSDGDMLIKYCKKTEAWSVDKRRNGDYGVMLNSPLPSGTPDNTEPFVR
jgi:hypothetical protein